MEVTDRLYRQIGIVKGWTVEDATQKEKDHVLEFLYWKLSLIYKRKFDKSLGIRL
jgi:hypothetical protein